MGLPTGGRGDESKDAMDFTETPDRALAAARRAADAMAAHGVVPHPRNYALWYVHCAGSMPDLSRAIEAVSDSLRDTAAEPEELALVLTKAAEETRRFVDFNRSLEENLAQSSREIEQVREHLEALRREGRSDAVTGLASRRVFEIALKESVLLAEHDRHPLSVIVMDIDNFQNFLGSFGERVGDQVLRLIGRSITENVKGQDTVSRYADQTFAVILPDTRAEQAERSAESIRAGIAARSVVNRRTQTTLGQVTMSLGIAEWRPGEPPAELMRRAGEALHAAKAGGRNRAVSAP